ncbi:Rtf2 RING-finger-domain-containing protein [Halteromyces radiatus]|uniref:Rtf2 RING-finger-domain-containing protein n=1 Tax=Halteromyces radiatus TaxID=101107 RepID=UPI0022206FEA|nr:Rtf2 RING-finger-domain-containing protein [Halteromyces radiatus]KAI8084476.1 Rtf2 RING-finger-domain-containing protein [Halteromyces radiatus]
MGNDGGSIPRRIELVKEKQKDVKQNPNLQREAAWFYCALSKRALELPIVADRLGKLYNQDVVIEYILDPTSYGDGDKICPYITSTKDTVKLNLTPNPAYNEQQNDTSTVVGSLDKDLKSKFICPISMKEMNGKHRFVYLDSCGCTFAEQTLKEVSSTQCLSCGKTFDKSNIITINPTTKEEIESMTKAMEEKKKNGKKKNNKKRTAEDGKDENGTDKKKKKNNNEHRNISTSVAASAVMDKVSKELAERQKTKAVSSAIQSLYTKKDGTSKIKGNYLTMGTFNRYS